MTFDLGAISWLKGRDNVVEVPVVDMVPKSTIEPLENIYKHTNKGRDTTISEVRKLFSCSAQMSMEFVLLIILR